MVNERNTRKDWLNYLLLGLFLYLAYLPLSSFLFAIKNDALTVNFPNKYFFSAALHSGYLPLWNPYVNFGLPLYADPGFSFWHPLTWLFGFMGYTAYTLALEILVYIWLGGIFMYRLGLSLGHGRLTAFLLGLLYMCCGFFIGNLSHTNFLTCAAFLPLVIQTFLHLQESFTVKRLLYAAISCYLLAAGGHPAIPIGSIYFFTAVLAGLILTVKGGALSARLATASRTNILLLLAVLGLTAPILLSWMEIWPYFNRAAPVFQPDQQGLGFSLPSWLSLLFPFATTAPSGVFGTDLSMRNGYFSFFGLILFVIALIEKKHRLQTVFLISGAFMTLLSLGGPVKSWLYSHLPFLQLIRTNGEYRVFALISFIIVLSWPLDSLLKKQKPPPIFNALMSGLAVLTLLTLLLSAPFIHMPPTPATGIVALIKTLLDNLSLATRLFINAGILLVLLLSWFLLRKKLSPRQLVPAILMADLILFCWLHLPVTGVQSRRPAEIDALFSSVPAGIPRPRLSPLAANIRPGASLEKIIGCWSYYSKQPGTPELCGYPTRLQSTDAYFQSQWPDTLNLRPFVFLDARRQGASLSIASFTPTQVGVDATSPTSDSLILLQNEFPGWEASIDGRPCPIQKKYLSFMGIAFPGGSHHVLFRYRNRRLLWYILIPLVTAGLLGIPLLGARAPKKSTTRALSDHQEQRHDPSL